MLDEAEFLVWTWIGFADTDVLKANFTRPQEGSRDIFEERMLNQINNWLIEKVCGTAVAGLFAPFLAICSGEQLIVGGS